MVGFEVLTTALIRDGLALNVLMLLYPVEAMATGRVAKLTGFAPEGVLSGGQDLARTIAEADAVTVALCMAAQGQRIAVLDEGAGLAGVQRDRLVAAPAQFQQRSVFAPFRGPIWCRSPSRSPTFIGAAADRVVGTVAGRRNNTSGRSWCAQ